MASAKGHASFLRYANEAVSARFRLSVAQLSAGCKVLRPAISSRLAVETIVCTALASDGSAENRNRILVMNSGLKIIPNNRRQPHTKKIHKVVKKKLESAGLTFITKSVFYTEGRMHYSDS